MANPACHATDRLAVTPCGFVETGGGGNRGQRLDATEGGARGPASGRIVPRNGAAASCADGSLCPRRLYPGLSRFGDPRGPALLGRSARRRRTRPEGRRVGKEWVS